MVMQLNISQFIERGGELFPDNSVVTRLPDGSLHRYGYGDCLRRVRRVASQLHTLGIKPGDKVATLAWNSYRHFELYFAIPSVGAVLHTVNLRLVDEHIRYILNHSEDVAVFVDPDLLPVLERIAPELETVRRVVVLDESVPETALPDVIAYEDLVAAGDESFEFPEVDENAPAGMCYTSATTGMPKGAVYTQRGIWLHTAVQCMADAMAVRERDTFLLMVPMFHANGWGIPFAAAWMGASIILPGPRPHAPVLLDLIESERATFFAAAVSVGIDVMNLLKERPRDLASLRAIMLGGSATPRALMEFFMDEYGIPIYTAWGSTEMTPLATMTHLNRRQLDLPEADKITIRTRQGLACPGARIEVRDEAGNPIPWDDVAIGEVYAKTPWQATEYYRDERTREGFIDGWWKSGDIAAINGDGVLRLVDRAKDLIKSGGEWISSVDLENALLAHPGVREAAVVAVPDEKWVERPAAYVVREPGAPRVTAEMLQAHLAKDFAKWWLPDRVIFIDAIPKTGVGKINKRQLREQVAADTN